MLTRTFLTLFCCLLLLVRAQDCTAVVKQVGVGGGYVRGACLAGDKSRNYGCYSGGRTGFNLDLSYEGPLSNRSKSTNESGGGSWALQSMTSSYAPNGATEVYVIAGVVVLLLFGAYWTVATIASQQLKLGIYASFDVLSGERSTSLDGYSVFRAGFATTVYLIPNFDLALRAKIGPIWGQYYGSVVGNPVNFNGYSVEGGIGYLPATESGVYVMAEIGMDQLSRSRLKREFRDNLSSIDVPSVQKNMALVGGYLWAF